MSKRNKAQKPLVYIEQPTTDYPIADMQQSYRTNHAQSKVQQTTTNKQASRKIHPFNQMFMNEFADESSEVTDEALLTDSLSEDVQEKKEEKFSELSIDHKIEYLLDRPQFIPALTCKIQTTDGNYFGKILKFKENIVSLRKSRSRAVKRIDRKEIIDINLVGF